VENWERTGREHGPEIVAGWYDEAWRAEVERMREKQPDIRQWMTGGRTKPQVDLERREARGREQALAYVEWATATADKWRVWQPEEGEYACEVEFSIQLAGVTVIGFIDQIIEWRDGTLTPRDLKTGTKLPESPLQLATYARAAEEIFPGISLAWGDYYMAKNTAPTELMPLEPWTRDRIARWYYDFDRAVKAGIFVPNIGDHCRVCLVADYCDATGGMRDEYPREPIIVLPDSLKERIDLG
jgi:RecB family exonuclease